MNLQWQSRSCVSHLWVYFLTYPLIFAELMTGLCSLGRGLLAHSFFPALCCFSTSFLQRPARWRTAAANLGSTEGHCAGGRGRDNAKHLSSGLREVSASKKKWVCSQHGVLSNVLNIYLHWLQNEIKAALAPPACVEESRARKYSRCAPVIHLSRLSLCVICFFCRCYTHSWNTCNTSWSWLIENAEWGSVWYNKSLFL